MSDQQKKVLVIAAAVVAVVLAGWSAYRTLTKDQIVVGVSAPNKGPTLKQLEMQNQAKDVANAKAGEAGAGNDADLSGAIGGAGAGVAGAAGGSSHAGR